MAEQNLQFQRADAVFQAFLSESPVASLHRCFLERALVRPDRPAPKRTSSRHEPADAVYKAYEFTGYPDEKQQSLFRQTFGCRRWLWNRMVDDFRHRRKVLTPAGYKPEHDWLRIPDSLALANTQLDFQAAVSDWKSGGRGKPRFKKKGLCRDSYKTCIQGDAAAKTARLESEGILELPKAGDVRVKAHRKILPGGIMKNVTVSLEPDGTWLFTIVFEYPAEDLAFSSGITAFLSDGCVDDIRAIGLDMSLPGLFVSSDGTVPAYTLTNNTGEHAVSFGKQYRRLEKRIAREQRKLSHMKKHSANYRKQCRRIAKLHAKAKHQRRDFLRQMAVRLARSYDIIGIEDLDMRAMKRALRFGKSVSDNGWGLFTRYLEEACTKTGSLLLRVDKWFPSSKTCCKCGYVHKELRLSDRTYVCPVCGNVMDRDGQAAVNIRKEALRIFTEEIAPVIRSTHNKAAAA